MSDCWDVLGVPRGSDRAAIRRAYARALKVTNPEDDPQGFMALREAYESALNWVDYDYDWDEDAEAEWAEEDAVAPVPPSPTARQPFVAPVTVAEDLDPLAQAHATEHAELRELTVALESALRGPWFKDATMLKFLIGRILSAPAMIEIETRERIEYWLADLLAETVPRSDPILVRAIESFGWEVEGERPPAVWRILGRIDEWRMIQTLVAGDHALSGGWRTLTRKGEPGWQRRAGALRPGIAGQVQQLFDLADYQLPGIVHSFDGPAAAWWRDYLDRPRFGFIDLAAILTGAVVALICVLAIEPSDVGVASAAAALVAGLGFAVVRVRIVAPWRRRRDEVGEQSGWAVYGWIGLWLGAPLLLIWTPAGPWMAGITVALCAIASLWMAIVAGREPQIGNALGRIFSFGVLAVLGGAAFFALSGAEKLALLAFAGASMLIGSCGPRAIADLLWRAGSRPVLAATVLVAMLLAAAAGRSWLPSPPQPLVPWGAAAIAGMVLMHAVRDEHDGSWAARMTPLLRWGLWVVLVIAAVISSPPVDRGTAEPPMQQLERNEPGFTALKTGNPGLYAAVSAVWQQQADGKRNRDEASREIDRLVNIGYRARLPEAPSGLIASEFDIRLATMREYRTLDLRACAAGAAQGTSKSLSEALRKRHYRHALAVAASRPASAADLAAGQAFDTARLLRFATGGDATRSRELADAMLGSDLKAKCGARIALMEALSMQSMPDIAKTMRPALIARAGESSNKLKGGDQAP